MSVLGSQVFGQALMDSCGRTAAGFCTDIRHLQSDSLEYYQSDIREQTNMT